MAAITSLDFLRALEISQSGKAHVSTEELSDKATYSATFVGAVTATTASDIFTISGSGTKVIRVIGFVIGATQTTAGTMTYNLIKRSTLNTAGSPNPVTPVAFDSADGAATALVRAYTANPTVGTAVGTLFSMLKLTTVATTLTGEDKTKFLFFKDLGMKEPVLRTVNDLLALNLNNGSHAGNNFTITVFWVEE